MQCIKLFFYLWSKKDKKTIKVNENKQNIILQQNLIDYVFLSPNMAIVKQRNTLDKFFFADFCLPVPG